MIQSGTIDPDKRLRLICCGILKKEIKQLVEKNQWPIKSTFLDSSLHIDFEKLSNTLTRVLSKNQQKKLVVYGTCHPKMDEILSEANAVRTPGQNCVELLLGREKFSLELSKGAFFLFEDWAKRWEDISYNYFGNWDIMREIFQDAHKYILCIRTPCSGNFDTYANQVSLRIGLPLVWKDFKLDQLEKTLAKSVFELIDRQIND